MKTITTLSKKIRKRAFKKKVLRLLFVVFLSINLIGYQTALPLSLSAFSANAQETESNEEEPSLIEEIEDEKIEDDEDAEKEEQKKDEVKEKDQETADEEAQEEAVSKGEETDEAGQVDENEKLEIQEETQDLPEQSQENGSTLPLEQNGQSEVGSEAGGEEVLIENENNLVASNEAVSLSNTGNNLIGIQIDESAQVAKGEETENGAQEPGEPAVLTEEVQTAEQLAGESQGESQTGLVQEEIFSEAESEEQAQTSEEDSTLQEENFQEQEVFQVASETEFLQDNQEIQTGDALAVADIVNEANENIVGANWVNTVINLYGLSTGDVDLNSIFLQLIGEMVLGNQQTPAQDLAIFNQNDANVENSALAQANTGENAIVAGGDADAAIETGDADAFANVVNIVNKNIVGDNWIFAVINVFGTWTGDLIVPGEGLASFPFLQQYNEVTVENNNNASISNLAHADSNTGANIVSASGNALVETGGAVSSANVFTLANTNLVQNNWFSLAVNETGGWLGSVLNWQGELDGNLFQYFFSSDQSETIGASLFVQNNNSAQISNVAQATANTGNNSIALEGATGSITSGNAGAFANIFNLVNTNIVGNNWFFGIVNVMGAWEGDLEFAYPDLEISIDDGRSQAQEGEVLEYAVSYKNNGKAPAENARITFGLEGEARYSSGDGGMKVSGSGYGWDVGTVAPGQSGSLAIKARVSDGLEAEVSQVVASAEIETGTTEQEKSNNKDSDSTEAKKSQSSQDAGTDDLDGYFGLGDLDSSIKVSRFKTITGPVAGGEIVYNAIVVKNNGEVPVFDVRVKDLMSDAQGVEVVKFTWPIGDLSQGDEILIEYQLQVNQSALPGDYQFSAYAKGEDPYEDEVNSRKAVLGMNVYQLGGYFSSQSASGDQAPFEFLPAVQASDDVAVLSANDTGNTCLPLPFWIWISALVAYGLLVNWALFPWKGGLSEKKAGKGRIFAAPFGATIAMAMFWLAYRCDSMLWFLIATFLILFVHLVVKKNSQDRTREMSVFNKQSRIFRF